MHDSCGLVFLLKKPQEWVITVKICKASVPAGLSCKGEGPFPPVGAAVP